MKKDSVRAFDNRRDGCGGDAGLGHCLASWDLVSVSVWWGEELRLFS